MLVRSTPTRNGNSSGRKSSVSFVPTERSTVSHSVTLQPFWGTVIQSEQLAYQATPQLRKRYAAYDAQLAADVRRGVHLLLVLGRGIVHHVLPTDITTTPRHGRLWFRPCQLRDRSPQQEGPRCTCWRRLAVEQHDTTYGRIQWVILCYGPGANWLTV